MDVVTAARGYKARGFYCVPIPTGQKGPRITGWQKLRLEDEALDCAFTASTRNVGLVLGTPSGGLVDVDLDCEEAVRLAEQYLPSTGAITGRTGREGSHWWYVCDGAETVRYQDRKCASDSATTVELRSTGAQTVVGPSIHPDGSTYDLLTGNPARVPVGMLSACVEALHNAILSERGHQRPAGTAGDTGFDSSVRSLGVSDGSSEESGFAADQPAGVVAAVHSADRANRNDRPGDDYNERGDLHALLLSHGWSVFGKSGENVQLTRPGKSSGLSATWNGDRFYVFTSSCPQFEPDRGYCPFEVFTRLEHGGDHSAAAAELARQGFGQSQGMGGGVDLSGLLNVKTPATVGMGGVPNETVISKPKTPAFPEHLLRVPGFVGSVTQHSLATAHRPQPVLSLWAAICLQATLCGRKICDPFGNRTNLYVIALADSGNGKAHPRSINQKILLNSGMAEHEGPEDIASDSGLLASIAHQPALLMQLDEVGRLLQSCASAGSQASHLYNIATLLLRIYSAADSVYKGKAYGDRAKNVEINQPCLTIFGTTVAGSFWGSMSSESINDGFLARLIPVIADPDPVDQLVRQQPIPESILHHATEWGTYRPGGNLASINPSPHVVEYTVEAEAALAEWRAIWNAKAKSAGVWRPVWVRAAEKACRLALVYVASRGTKGLRIDLPAIEWACEVADYTTSLFESEGDLHIADSEFERWCQAAQRRIEKGGSAGITFARLCNFVPFKSLDMRQSQLVIDKLRACEAIHTSTNRQGGVVCYPGPVNVSTDESTEHNP
jgi:hypothetical protein